MAMHRATSAEAEVQAVIEDWADAIRTKDAARVVAHGTADFVQFSLAPPLITDTNVEGLTQWFATWRGAIDYSLHDLRITAGDDVAFAHSLNRMRGTHTSGEATDLWFRHTLCLRKVGGDWKIAHEHESVPFYMDGSMKAALDLKP
jgi:PhnB protein